MSKQYKNPTCKGSHALGTACGNCERCKEQTPYDRAEKFKPKRPQNNFIVVRGITPPSMTMEAVIDTMTGEVTAYSNTHAHDIANALNKAQEG